MTENKKAGHCDRNGEGLQMPGNRRKQPLSVRVVARLAAAVYIFRKRF